MAGWRLQSAEAGGQSSVEKRSWWQRENLMVCLDEEFGELLPASGRVHSLEDGQRCHREKSLVRRYLVRLCHGIRRISKEASGTKTV